MDSWTDVCVWRILKLARDFKLGTIPRILGWQTRYILSIYIFIFSIGTDRGRLVFATSGDALVHSFLPG